jgi:CheY-like chemotaxis protein
LTFLRDFVVAAPSRRDFPYWSKNRGLMKILIADDNPTNLSLLQDVLEAEGHEVVAANDGSEALAVLAKETVDAVISDIFMPNMDGYRLCY